MSRGAKPGERGRICRDRCQVYTDFSVRAITTPSQGKVFPGDIVELVGTIDPHFFIAQKTKWQLRNATGTPWVLEVKVWAPALRGLLIEMIFKVIPTYKSKSPQTAQNLSREAECHGSQEPWLWSQNWGDSDHLAPVCHASILSLYLQNGTHTCSISKDYCEGSVRE